MQNFKNISVEWFRKIFDIASRSMVDFAIREIRTDILGSQILSPLNVGYIPWAMPAMRPGAIASILNDIVINRRNIIVELGSGVSTVYIARLLKQLGIGHLYTIEHDDRWIDTLKQMLTAEKDYVTFIHAPLVPLKKIKEGTWYDVSVVTNALRSTRIDLLVVDGPPSMQSELMIRYPAIPILKSMFSDDFAVVLDDVSRKGEREILSLWKKELDLEFHVVSHAAVGLSRTAYRSYIG